MRLLIPFLLTSAAVNFFGSEDGEPSPGAHMVTRGREIRPYEQEISSLFDAEEEEVVELLLPQKDDAALSSCGRRSPPAGSGTSSKQTPPPAGQLLGQNIFRHIDAFFDRPGSVRQLNTTAMEGYRAGYKTHVCWTQLAAKWVVRRAVFEAIWRLGSGALFRANAADAAAAFDAPVLDTEEAEVGGGQEVLRGSGICLLWRRVGEG